MKHSLFPDEFLAFKRKELSLEQDFKQAWKEVWEALKQSSETSHDNAPLDAAKLSWELASKKIQLKTT